VRLVRECVWTCCRRFARPRERLFNIVFEFVDGRGLGAETEEKREPAGDVDTAVVDSLKST
jgi:hypothetical protein